MSPDVDYPLFSWVAPNISGFVRGREGYLEELIVREKLRGGNTEDDDDNQREGGRGWFTGISIIEYFNCLLCSYSCCSPINIFCNKQHILRVHIVPPSLVRNASHSFSQSVFWCDIHHMSYGDWNLLLLLLLPLLLLLAKADTFNGTITNSVASDNNQERDVVLLLLLLAPTSLSPE